MSTDYFQQVIGWYPSVDHCIDDNKGSIAPLCSRRYVSTESLLNYTYHAQKTKKHLKQKNAKQKKKGEREQTSNNTPQWD